VLKEIYVGFVDISAGILFAATLTTGDVFIFPKRLVHFQLETGKDGCLNLRFGSPKPPSVQHIATSLFGRQPDIMIEVLAKTFGTPTLRQR
jgi:hypothetical protein